MIKYLKKILGICEHKWVVYGKVAHHYDNHPIPTYYLITLQCAKCGDMKNFKQG